MIYTTSKCPYCGEYVKFMEKEKKAYGNPLRTCSHCRKVYVDSDIEEPAMKSKGEYYWQIIKEVFAISIIIAVVIGILIMIICDTFEVNGTFFDNNTVVIIAYVVLLSTIFIIYFLRNGTWKNDPEVLASVNRLRDAKYRELLAQAGRKIYRSSIFNYFEENQNTNNTLQNNNSEAANREAHESKEINVQSNELELPVSENEERIEVPVQIVKDGKEAVSFCRKCGAQVLPDSEFCSKCGNKLYND